MIVPAYSDTRDLNLRTHIMNHYRSHSQEWHSWLQNQLNLPANGRFLDLGSGPGTLWQAQGQLPLTHKFLCLSDLSVNMLKEARETFKYNPAITYALLNAAVLPFGTSAFSGAFAFGLLDQLPDVAHALGEISRVIQPGGLFYTSAGGQRHLKELRELITPFLPTADYGGNPDKFGLENGQEQLASYFTRVELRPYTNKLVFKEKIPLLAFALSEPEVRKQLTAHNLAAFKQHVAEELARKGEIQITINKGLFIARNPW